MMLEVSVKTLYGTFSVRVRPDSTVESFENMIRASEGTPKDQQRLAFDGQELGDGASIGSVCGNHGVMSVSFAMAITVFGSMEDRRIMVTGCELVSSIQCKVAHAFGLPGLAG